MHKRPSSIPKQLHEPAISTTIPGHQQLWKDVTLKTLGDESEDGPESPFCRRDPAPCTAHTRFTPRPLCPERWSIFSVSAARSRGLVPPSPAARLSGIFLKRSDVWSPSSSSGSHAPAEMERLFTSQHRHRQDVQGTAVTVNHSDNPPSAGTPRTVYGDRRQRGLTFEKLCSVPRCFAGNKGQDGGFVGAQNSRFSWGSIKWVEFTLPWYNSSDCVRIAPGIGHAWLVFLITSLPS